MINMTNSVSVLLLAGDPNQAGGWSADGPAVTSRLNLPWGIAVGPDGRKVFWAEEGNSIVRKLDLDTMSVSTVAGQAGTVGTADGAALSARFGPTGPRGLAMYGWDLLIADTGEGRAQAPCRCLLLSAQCSLRGCCSTANPE
jgi:hypothetical protein